MSKADIYKVMFDGNATLRRCLSSIFLTMERRDGHIKWEKESEHITISGNPDVINPIREYLEGLK
jgi:hypothetical protein